MSEILLVVDMQNGFMSEKCRHIIPTVIKLIERFLADGKLVKFTRFINTADSNYVKLIHWSRLMQESETSIIDELQPYINNVFDKHYYSAFTESFSSFIFLNQISKIYLCGIATDSCILKTAIDSFERGIEPVIIEDACSSHGGQQAHNAGIFLLKRNIGKNQIKMTDEILQEMS
ncbi:MAG: isochorismatase family cysteine hydrolase [Nostoc sp. DedQUE12b]|uniref:isochorismatase family cysteine hydrolase n=1 Tax=unclassified Nostoc TaxID=2593658 RepID=UPI002AD3490D|nr:MULTISPECIES: isochorismatase family cysteine hydrolase [unclassified Nostoc]MDZ7954747.1 isochorismatase family cysteine hydrolase [Nostoc sp. DedQUE09]MDZ8086903.1 isochorismatase family cysteine hydrolase [Nostoc sp. DedQUE12b]